jgi:TRAP-type C4-dicarboxylate transport system permease small subunit
LKPKKQNILLNILNYFTAFALVVMVVLVFINAFLRYAFNSSIPASEELSRYFFIWVSFLGAIVAFKDKRHVGVDILTQKLKGVPKKVVETIGDLIMLFAFGVMFFGGISFFLTSATSKGPTTGIPFGFISVSIIVASVAMAGLVIFGLYKRFSSKEEEGR